MSGIRAVFLVARKDLRRKIRSPLATVTMLLFPIVFSLLIGITFGGGGDTLPPIRLALVDDDGGLFGKLLQSALSQKLGPQSFEIEAADSTRAIELVENNKVSAALRIPPGFGDSLFTSRPTRLELVKNPAQGIYPQIAERYVAVLAQLGSAVIRLLGGPIGEIHDAAQADVASPDAFISDVSLSIHHDMQRISRYAFPPAIRLEKPKPEGEESTGGTPFQIAVFMLPGMAIFALMMLALVSLSDFQREGARGTLARQAVAPISFGSVVFGKIAATWVQSLACIVILTLVATIMAKTGLPLAEFLVLSIFFALAATGFAAFIQSLSRSERTGSAIGSILIMVMSMVGGSWIPLESLPAFAQHLAPFTPVYWGSEGYRALLFQSASVGDLLPNLAVLFLTGSILSMIAILRLRQRYGSGA